MAEKLLVSWLLDVDRLLNPLWCWMVVHVEEEEEERKKTTMSKWELWVVGLTDLRVQERVADH